MSISDEIRMSVRQNAGFACEFCGVSETDVGGELTIDHFRPISEGGDDQIENLLYCCSRCNLYKLDYFPNSSSALLTAWPLVKEKKIIDYSLNMKK